MGPNLSVLTSFSQKMGTFWVSVTKIRYNVDANLDHPKRARFGETKMPNELESLHYN